MAWTSVYTYTVGQVLTAANLNTYLSANTTYLKSQTDLFNLTVYNNGSTVLNVGAPVIFDPAYTAGLGVAYTTNAADPRIIGVVVNAAISGSASGLIWAPGYMIQNILVAGAVTFGHSLVSSTTPQYAQDSGGGGIVNGMLGWALAASTGGTATISALLKVQPQYYALASSVIRTQTNNNITFSSSAGALTTAISNAISDGNNKMMLVWGFNGAGASPATFGFNAGSFTQLQAGGALNPYFGYLLPSAATANITAYYGSYNGACVDVFLNGINQGSPVGTAAAASSTTASASVSVTIACNPGDLVIAGFITQTSAITISARGAGQSNLADIAGPSNIHTTVDSAVAAGANITFTWTISAAQAWSAVGVAVKSA
jgi:hypothetical protein